MAQKDTIYLAQVNIYLTQGSIFLSVRIEVRIKSSYTRISCNYRAQVGTFSKNIRKEQSKLLTLYVIIRMLLNNLEKV